MKVINLFLLMLLFSCATDHRDGRLVLNESLRQCYVESDSYTGKNGTVQGQMTVNLSIDANNKVKSCKIIKNDFKDPNLNACVCGIFKLTGLNDPEIMKGKEIEVTQLVNFHPVQQ